jgi:hypothetical protein
MEAKSNKFIKCFLIAFIFSIHFSFSQSNFKDGYIITKTNDTITGLIDFRTAQINAHKCKFKHSEKEKEELYYPGDIKGYMFVNEGKYYVSRDITLNGKNESVFLEFLVEGLMNLYFYPAEINHYFFENTDGRFLEVSKKPDEIVGDKVIIDNKYIGMLKYIFMRDSMLLNQTSKATFDRKTMIEFTKKYHDLLCTDGRKCIIFENDYRKKFIKINFAAYLSAQYIIYTFESDIPEIHIDSKSIIPVIGGQLLIVSPRLIKTIGLQIDVSASNLKGASDFSDAAGIYYRYGFNTIKTNANVSLKYTYPKGKIRPTIESGVLYTHLLRPTSSLESYIYNGQSFTIETKENYSLPYSDWVGYTAGLGVEIQINRSQFMLFKVLYDNSQFKKYGLQSLQVKLGYIF